MPILDIEDTGKVSNSKPEDIPRRVYRNNQEMGTSTLFAKDHQLDHIVRYIKGMKWTVDYFLQLRGPNDELSQLDLNLPATTQKYHRINKLIITLQSAIEQSNVTEITGQAIINAGFLPNKDDIFVATLTGGREALFTITKVELRTYNLHQTYYVDFKLLTFFDKNNADLYNNLVFKTVKEYQYDKDHLLDYSAPVILKADYNKKINLKYKYKEIVDYYFTNFVHPTAKVLSPPTKSSVYTDTFITKFIFKIIDVNDTEHSNDIIKLDDSRFDKIKFTVWDSLISRDPTMLKRCTRNIGFKFMPYNLDNIISRQFNYIGVNFTANILDNNEKGVIPEYEELSTKEQYFPKNNEMGWDSDSHSIVSNVPMPDIRNRVDSSDDSNADTNNNSSDGNSNGEERGDKKVVGYQKPILHPVNDVYVFSPFFYNKDLTNCGILEKAVWNYLDAEIINQDTLDILIEQYHMWSTKDQYYLIPVLLVLIKDSINNTFKSI